MSRIEGAGVSTAFAAVGAPALTRMTLGEFLEHWRITDNPFMGEEARHDLVFTRLREAARGQVRSPSSPPAATASSPDSGTAEQLNQGPQRATDTRPGPITHPDFEKILGDCARPSSSIVFGEKGSGKTAIRLQIEQRVGSHNAAHPSARTLLVPYDDLNSVLDPYCARLTGPRVTIDQAFKKLRHLDHIDAIIAMVVPRIVDAILGGPDPLDMVLVKATERRRAARRLAPSIRRDLVLLQALYDRPETAADRTPQLRRLLRLPLPISRWAWSVAVWLGWLPSATAAAWVLFVTPALREEPWAAYLIGVLAVLWSLALGKRLIWDRVAMVRSGVRVRRQLRVVARGDRSFGRSLLHVDPALRAPNHLPVTDADEPRYAMIRRLQRVLACFGWTSVIVVVDRVDEPTLVRGEPDRMRAVVWPLLNNKLLQQEGIGLKLLLPIELRHLLFKESGAFFQEARLDKQNLIERLVWTGPMLYDLCDTRLAACRPADADPVTLLDLFAEDVTRQDVTEALGHMQQPRDAFKMLYQCFLEHCASVPGPEPQWRIPRAILEMVRKQQVDRVQQLHRGIRPA